MIKTAVSSLIALIFIISLSLYECFFISATFEKFNSILTSLYEKTENSIATHEDGIVAQTFWREKKKHLHVWLPHTAINTVDSQLSEALGYLYEGKFTDALPKLEVLIDFSETIPRSFKLLPENIF
jgi:hypothetical protein